MNIKNWLLSGLAGGVTMFLLGGLVYGMLLGSFFEGQTVVPGVMRDESSMVWWGLIVGNIVMGLMFSYIWVNWAGIKTFMTGAKGGAIIGFLMTLAINLIMYSTTNISTMQAVLVDSVVWIFMGGIAGGVIGLVNGALDKS